MSEEPLSDKVGVFEDWNERDGNIYYRWRLEGEETWHEKLTPYTEKPYFTYEEYTKVEWSIKRKKLESEHIAPRKLAQKPIEGRKGN